VYTVPAYASALGASCTRTMLLELVASQLQQLLDATCHELDVNVS